MNPTNLWQVAHHVAGHNTTTNGAVLAGYTKEVFADCSGYNLHLLVKPDTDFDSRFSAFCTDEMEMINVNGWLFEIEDV